MTNNNPKDESFDVNDVLELADRLSRLERQAALAVRFAGPAHRAALVEVAKLSSRLRQALQP